MYILLRHFDGRLQEAMVLSIALNSMRVGMPGEDDAVELTLRDGFWLSGRGDAMEVEFLAATAEDEWNSFFEVRQALDEIDAWAAQPLPVGCVPTPAAAGRMAN